jgi:hypothetical protein
MVGLSRCAMCHLPIRWVRTSRGGMRSVDVAEVKSRAGDLAVVSTKAGAPILIRTDGKAGHRLHVRSCKALAS